MSAITYRNFQSGELDPAQYSRVDLPKYATGLVTCRNNIIMRTGGAQNRAGTKFVAEVKSSSDGARLIPFIYNDDQTFVLEFGDEYVRFHRDGAQVTETGIDYSTQLAEDMAIFTITQASPGVVTVQNSTGATYPYFMSLYRSSVGGITLDVLLGILKDGDEIVFSDIRGMVELNGRNLRVANVVYDALTTSFTLEDLEGNAIDTTSFSAYTLGGKIERVFEIESPYSIDDVGDLQWTQSADVMTFSHQSYVPKELARTLEFSWAFASADLDPDIGTPVATNDGTAGPAGTSWRVQAVSHDGEESNTTATTSSDVPSAGAGKIVVSWAEVTGAVSYKVYRSLATAPSIYYLIDTTSYLTIDDVGATGTLDYPSTFPFNGTNANRALPVTDATFKPAAVGYFQQRLFYGDLSTRPEGIYGSRIGHYNNFFTGNDLADSDALAFTLAGGRRVSEVRHLLDVNGLLIGTPNGIYVATGNESGTITSDINGQNPKLISSHGMSWVRPVVVGDTLIYVDKNGSVLRDLGTEVTPNNATLSPKERMSDITADAAHLFDGYQISDLDYQEAPNSIVWAQRDDGIWLGCTYYRDRNMVGWHRHDTSSDLIESMCVIPEDGEDHLYLMVNRDIDGQTKRYVERLESRFIDDIVDAKFMDSSISYDGREVTAATMTLSGSGWEYDDELTLTASVDTFLASDVGNEFHLTDEDGEIIRFRVTGYTSPTVVTGKPNRTVPTSLQATAADTWARAVDELTNLWHLEGEEVSVFADAYVVGSPNNPSFSTVYTVENGAITLDRPYGVIHVGLPYISDLETLDIDTAQSETLSDKKKLVTAATVRLHQSRGMWVGLNPGDDSLDGLSELKIRDNETYDEPVELASGNVTVNFDGSWDSNGRVLIRQVDPLPLTVLSITPTGLFPFRK